MIYLIIHLIINLKVEITKQGVGHFAKLHFARLHFANFFESMWRIKKMWHFAKLQFAKLKIIK